MTPHDPLPWLRRFLALAFVFVWVSLLAVNAGAADPPITIMLSPLTVKPGSEVSVEIRLNNVKDAKLNGEVLKGDHIKKKFTLSVDTTFTVTATDKKGQPLTQSATAHVTAITVATGAPGPSPVPLPDLMMTSATDTVEAIPGNSTTVTVTLSFDFWNRGMAAITTPYVGYAYKDGALLKTFDGPPLNPQQTMHGTWILTLPKDQTYRLTITLDPDNRIHEFAEDNNSMTTVVSTRALVLGQYDDKVKINSDILKFLVPKP
jgi:subtilase family serine protease